MALPPKRKRATFVVQTDTDKLATDINLCIHFCIFVEVGSVGNYSHPARANCIFLSLLEIFNQSHSPTCKVAF